uniref:RNase_PH domain-containing protein n=1 Tax=Macrostomum lignano TaxID=282301 RepID=A0A1I8FNH8_9PLAT
RSSAPMRQDNSLFLSTNERKAIANSKHRQSVPNRWSKFDRHSPDSVSICRHRIRCCVTARLGATIVVAKVTHDVVEPWPHRPAEGQLQVNLEVPSTDGSQQQQLDDDGLRAQRALERCFKESRCLDLESLCIVPGERVFLIRVTATVINNDGNVIDCAAMAVGAVRVGENATVQLNLNFYPLVQTFGLFDSDGKYIVADLSAKTGRRVRCLASMLDKALASRRLDTVDLLPNMLLSASGTACDVDMSTIENVGNDEDDGELESSPSSASGSDMDIAASPVSSLQPDSGSSDTAKHVEFGLRFIRNAMLQRSVAMTAATASASAASVSALADSDTAAAAGGSSVGAAGVYDVYRDSDDEEEVTMVTQLMRFQFFETGLLRDLNTGESFKGLADIEGICCWSCGHGLLVFGDKNGFVYLVGRNSDGSFDVTNFRAFDDSTNLLHQFAQHDILISVGLDQGFNEQRLKVWSQLDRPEADGGPVCSRVMRVAIDPATLAKQQPQMPPPFLTCLTAHENLSCLLLGFSTGGGAAAPRRRQEGATQPVPCCTGGRWARHQPALQVSESRVTTVFATTDKSVFALVITAKDHVTKICLESNFGAAPCCTCLSESDPDPQLVVANRTVAYFYNMDGRGACTAFDMEIEQ